MNGSGGASAAFTRNFGQEVDRPPLIVFATGFAARLEQVDPPRLWQDAGALTRTLLGLEGLFGLDAVVVEVPPDVLAERRLATVADGVARLRALLDERAALVLALPGPITGATSVGRGRAAADARGVRCRDP